MCKQFTENNTEKVFVKLGKGVISNRRNGGSTEVPSVGGKASGKALLEQGE